MRRSLPFIVISLTWSVASFSADPWFTGPLLANDGQATPKNHLNIQPYFFYTVNEDQFSHHPRIPTSIAQINDTFSMQATLGVTDAADIQVTGTVNHNVKMGQRFNGIADTNFLFGYQLLRQNNNPNRPNIRFTLQETIPTGRYTNLSPTANGTDATGMGTYQTNFGMNLTQINEVTLGHYLQTTLNLNYLYAQATEISGNNAFGGDHFTLGKIKPGNFVSIDFALELTLTQNWVVVFETFCLHRQAVSFQNQQDPAIFLLDESAHIRGNPINEITLAPALEYNFNANFGILGGVWFSVGGKNTPDFFAPALTVTYLIG